MKTLRYVGPFDAVDIPDHGLEDIKQGSTFDVDDAAAALLLEQVDNFREVKPPAPAKRAASKVKGA